MFCPNTARILVFWKWSVWKITWIIAFYLSSVRKITRISELYQWSVWTIARSSAFHQWSVRKIRRPPIKHLSLPCLAGPGNDSGNISPATSLRSRQWLLLERTERARSFFRARSEILPRRPRTDPKGNAQVPWHVSPPISLAAVRVGADLTTLSSFAWRPQQAWTSFKMS